jgi:exosortase
LNSPARPAFGTLDVLHNNCDLRRLDSGDLALGEPVNYARAQAVQEDSIPIDFKERFSWLQLTVLFALMGVLYHGIVASLISDWWSDPNFSHGFFVPLFSALIVWQRRKKLASLPLRPSWSGIIVIAGALAVLVAGVFGAELFLSRSSLVLLLAGLIIRFAGWTYFRALLFPWAVLFLMIPIPVIVFNEIALPLQFFASRLATWLLGALGVPVLREGNVISLPSMTLEVVEACSGIRSLVSLITLAVMYGYFAEPRRIIRVVLVLAAIPVAVVTNGIRIMGTGLLGQYWDPEKAQNFFHEFSGGVIFFLALALLYLMHRSFVLFEGHQKERSA